ncbi:MAG: hypothetical protein ABJE47_08795 [bacterium]
MGSTKLLLWIGAVMGSLQLGQGVPATPDSLIKSGPYRNAKFQYLVQLPPGFQHELAPPSQEDRGFRARLPVEGTVWMAATHSDSTTIAGIVSVVRKSHRACRETANRPTKLAGLEASDMEFTCPGPKGDRANRFVIAVRKDPSGGLTEYVIGLESPVSMDGRAITAFEIIRRGFRVTGKS